MRESYGQLYPRFWDGPTGQAIQRKGKVAVILAAFLLSNRWANMIGLYELPIELLIRTLLVIPKKRDLLRGLDQLSDVDGSYSVYDHQAGVVWVREMARIRLQLEPGTQLSRKDNRHRHVVRAYETVKPNAFLGAFWDRYAIDLNLPQKRSPLEAPSEGAYKAPSQAPSQAPSKGLVSPLVSVISDQVQRSGTEISDQVQLEQPPAAPAASHPVENLRKPDEHLRIAEAPADDGNYRVIARMARDLLQHRGVLEEGDLIDAVKTACAQHGVDYGRHPDVAADVVHRACTSELFKFRHPDIAGRAVT